MPPAPITVKLRCASWRQLASIHRRDLSRSAFFLKSTKPPPVGTRIRINLTLPSETLIILTGTIAEHVPMGGMGGRGPGIDIKLNPIPQSAMWLIESAIQSAESGGGPAAARAPRGPARRQAGAQPTAREERLARAQSHPGLRREAPASESEPPPAVEDGIDLVEAEDELVEALQQELESLKKLNPFQVLGVGYGVDDDAVRRAFGELTKRYHPDRFARYESAEARELAAEIFIVIRDAYRRLVDAASRERMLRHLREHAALAKGLAHAPTAHSVPAPQAAAPPRPGPAAGQDQAARLLERGEYDAAIRIYAVVSRRDPKSREARVGLELAEGLKALAQRDRLEAAQRFEEVLELDPSNERAARELAEMRRHATNERKGLLSRLLGKEE